MVKQGVELSSKPHIVVSTPGRLADHIKTGTNFSLSRLHYLVCKRWHESHSTVGFMRCILFRFWTKQIVCSKTTSGKIYKPYSLRCRRSDKRCYSAQRSRNLSKRCRKLLSTNPLCLLTPLSEFLPFNCIISQIFSVSRLSVCMFF